MTLPKSSPKATAIFSPSAEELVQANILGCKMAFDILLVYFNGFAISILSSGKFMNLFEL